MGEERSEGIDRHQVPRWVKVFGIVAVGLILLFILMLLFGGGKHGPGRHMRSSTLEPVITMAKLG